MSGPGVALALVARSEARLQEVAAAVRERNGNVAAIVADLSRASGAEAAATEIHERLGAPSALLHLVGTYAGGHDVADTEEEEWDLLFTTNLWTAFHAIRAFLPEIRAAEAGRIVTVSTPLAAAPGPRSAGYAASKAALEALTLSVARELAGTSATANVVLVRSIGDARPTDTRAEEVAEAIAWLTSPAAAAVNGQRIPVHGRA
jgi:NAD(P)-dependent dehydrogenase (short-subunit alcohol dehydrogenase family)